ncbi:MAG: polysaccharide deacetylase family protein [Clostridia bacterium]|nr:polysaccharide deacetylase family protein [Clostridia bacterium]
MKNKKIISFFAILSLLSLLCINVSADEAMSWYCTRNKDNKQPTAAPELRFVEEYGGYYVDKRHGDGDVDKVVYLTFDAGYENGNVEKILDVMKDEEVKGAFFILENLIVKNTELVKRMANEGHSVCNHTSRHKDMTTARNIDEFKAELVSLEETYRRYTGNEMEKYYRPPEGRFNEANMRYAEELGYKTIFWSFAYADWDNGRQMSAEAAKKKIMDNIHNGAVILLHPTSATNAEILGDVIRELKAQGFRFGTLDELTSKGEL